MSTEAVRTVEGYIHQLTAAISDLEFIQKCSPGTNVFASIVGLECARLFFLKHKEALIEDVERNCLFKGEETTSAIPQRLCKYRTMLLTSVDESKSLHHNTAMSLYVGKWTVTHKGNDTGGGFGWQFKEGKRHA